MSTPPLESRNPEIDLGAVNARVAERVEHGQAHDGVLSLGDDSDIAAAFQMVTWELVPIGELPAFELAPRRNVPAPAADGSYALAELLDCQDSHFVDVAYHSIMGRPADAPGREHFRALLRRGISKIEILGKLRYSDEGKAIGTRIPGLPSRYLGYRLARIPVLGAFARAFALLREIPGSLRRLTHLEARLEQVENAAREHAEALDAAVAELARGLAAGPQALQHAQQGLLDQLERRLVRQRIHGQAMAKSVGKSRQQMAAVEESVRAYGRALSEKSESIEGMRRDLGDIEAGLRSSLEEMAPRAYVNEALKALAVEWRAETLGGNVPDAFYASFEDRFRGPREEIKARQAVYLPTMAKAGAGKRDTPILDIACGRGEWLELLRQNDLTASGVDLNTVFIASCRELGLEVVEEDALRHLRRLESGSIGAVTCFHLIEHLPFGAVLDLADEVLRVLKPGGVAIFETPNPRNLQVGATSFYLDPSHRRPLPSPLSAALLELRGFTQVEVVELHPFPDSYRVADAPPGVNAVLNQLLFGPQDYAVIGWKRGAAGATPS